jgi:preprotein translocase subunit SecF
MSRLGNIGGRLYRGEVSVNFVGRKRTWYSDVAAVALSAPFSAFVLFVRGVLTTCPAAGGRACRRGTWGLRRRRRSR